MGQVSLGVIGHSGKENEHRLPIHPLHLERIDPGLRERLFLERGYGDRFGVGDDDLERYVGGVVSRDRLIGECDVIMLAKPLPDDLAELRNGQVLWGWPHCVQDRQITQLAIDKRLTLIAFEAMHLPGSDGATGVHVFHRNNEMAGYCSVLHALQLLGRTGAYGRRLSAAVIGFGATGRGAVTALTGHGVTDVAVLTQRDVAAVAAPPPATRMVHIEASGEDPARHLAFVDDRPVPLASYLAEHDIVVNCVLQRPDAPIVFLTEADVGRFRPGSLVVDVSCDAGMGFTWAWPTSFEDPMFRVGDDRLHYYAVDHSPTYLWDSATWEISEALLPHLATVLDGPAAWDRDETIRRAIEIRDGVVQNPTILSFQGRAGEYPHAPL